MGSELCKLHCSVLTQHDYEEEDRAYAGYAMHGLESEQYQDIRENRIAMLSKSIHTQSRSFFLFFFFFFFFSFFF